MRRARRRGVNRAALRNIWRRILALPAPEIYTTEYMRVRATVYFSETFLRLGVHSRICNLACPTSVFDRLHSKITTLSSTHAHVVENGC